MPIVFWLERARAPLGGGGRHIAGAARHIEESHARAGARRIEHRPDRLAGRAAECSVVSLGDFPPSAKLEVLKGLKLVLRGVRHYSIVSRRNGSSTWHLVRRCRRGAKLRPTPNKESTPGSTGVDGEKSFKNARLRKSSRVKVVQLSEFGPQNLHRIAQ